MATSVSAVLTSRCLVCESEIKRKKTEINACKQQDGDYMEGVCCDDMKTCCKFDEECVKLPNGDTSCKLGYGGHGMSE